MTIPIKTTNNDTNEPRKSNAEVKTRKGNYVNCGYQDFSAGEGSTGQTGAPYRWYWVVVDAFWQIREWIENWTGSR